MPAGKRVGYTMPVLAGAAWSRVDPKHDRQAGRLLLRGLHLEPGADPVEAVAATAAAAARLAAHLGADRVEAGDAMPAALAKALRAAGRWAAGGGVEPPKGRGDDPGAQGQGLPAGPCRPAGGHRRGGARPSGVHRPGLASVPDRPADRLGQGRGAAAAWAFDWNQLAPPDQTDPEGDPLVVLSNRDLTVLVSRRSAPMPFFVRDADGDVVYFVHRGQGTLETDYGPWPSGPATTWSCPRAPPTGWSRPPATTSSC